MAKWWEHLPPTTVAGFAEFPDLVSHVGWLCCWFSSLLQAFFYGFPPCTKNKFQLDPETRAIGLSASLNNVIYFIWINNIPSRVRGGGGGRQSYSQSLCKYNHHTCTITLHYTFTLICTCTCTGYIANMLKGFKTWILDMKHSSSLEELPLIEAGKL